MKNMSDVFEGLVKAKYVDNEVIKELICGECSGTDFIIQDEDYWMATTKDHAEYAAKAINFHDDLVEMVIKLKEFIDDRAASSSELELASDAGKLLESLK